MKCNSWSKVERSGEGLKTTLTWWLIGTAALVLALALSGCSSIDDVSRVPGVVNRAVDKYITLGGVSSGRLTEEGFAISDANIVTFYIEATEEARQKLLAYNNGSLSAALTQAGASMTIAALALGRAPIIAPGVVAMGSLGAQHVFNLLNTPAKANAWLEYVNTNTAAFDRYLADLAAEKCSTRISGTEVTNAGVTFNATMGANARTRDASLQNSRPTLADMQAVTVEPGGMAAMREAIASCNPESAARMRAAQKPQASVR